MFFQLQDDDLSFPNPRLAEDDGLLAMGGDLSPERLILAYSNGIFPWYNEGEPILWYSPHQRCVIYPDQINISKSLRKSSIRNRFQVTFNQAFERVIAKCALTIRKSQNGTWITNAMQRAYIHLHQKGYAESVEVWQDSRLVGGLYGVKINQVFCGESMFSDVSDASKTALVALAKTNVSLIDCQFPNEHLMSMGAEMITYDAYTRILERP